MNEKPISYWLSAKESSQQFNLNEDETRDLCRVVKEFGQLFDYIEKQSNFGFVVECDLMFSVRKDDPFYGMMPIYIRSASEDLTQMLTLEAWIDHEALVMRRLSHADRFVQKIAEYLANQVHDGFLIDEPGPADMKYYKFAQNVCEGLKAIGEKRYFEAAISRK